MKRIIALLIVCILLASTTGCDSSPSASQPTQKPSTQSTPATQSPKLTTKEKENLAQQIALKEVLETLRVQYGPSSTYRFREYDIDSTKYKIGSITQDGDEFTFKGTLYLYDVYGRLKDTATFSVTATVYDSGVRYAGWANIKLD